MAEHNKKDIFMSESAEIRNLMEKLVEILGKTYYGDVRFEGGHAVSVSKNKSKENILTASSFGLCVRVFSGNRWYYLGFNEINEEQILNETRRLVDKVGNKPSNLALQDSWEIDAKVGVKKNPDTIGLEEKVADARYIFNYLMREKKIINATALIAHSLNETIFMNTEGSILRQILPFFRLAFSAVAKEGKRVEEDFFVVARLGGYEIFRDVNLEDKMNKVCDGARELLRARIVRGGVHDIIVDPDITGVVAHESFGHGCEADQIMRGRSYLANLKGKKIVSELVSIHDNGTYEGERGFLFFDDDGIKTKDTVLVKNGVLVNFLHDRQSAALMGSEPTGNAKAQDFSRKVFVRMTNTYIEPGDWKLEELIEDTKSGYLLLKGLTGMEDPLGGNLQITAQKARKIKNGELGPVKKGVSISGAVLEFLNNIDALTKDFVLRGSGCGKGHEDYVPVSSGGPYMRVRKAIIG